MLLTSEFNMIQTRLTSNELLMGLACISSGLQLMPNRFELELKSFDNYPTEIQSATSSYCGITTLSSEDMSIAFYNSTQTTFIVDSEFDINEIVVRPKYVDEFKIHVRTLKIDNTLPKIFVD